MTRFCWSTLVFDNRSFIGRIRQLHAFRRSRGRVAFRPMRASLAPRPIFGMRRRRVVSPVHQASCQ